MIGKWNKSVILTYIGLAFGILGIALTLLGVKTKYALMCLMVAGVCDMFDGTVARRCKRTKEEKEFGIELDSLVDTINFLALPLVIVISLNNKLYYLPFYVMYAIFGVARLANFNISTPKNNKPVSYYTGLPVTMAAMIFPLVYLLSLIIKENIFLHIMNITTGITGLLFVLKIKVPKPNLISSIFLLLITIIATTLYIFI